MPTRRLKDLLNAPLATAYARAFVFLSPVVLGVLVYAGDHWVNAKIAEAPSVVIVTRESADTKQRVSALELHAKLAAQQDKTDREIMTEVKSDVKSVLATVNKMAGAMEARTGIKIGGTSEGDSFVFTK